MPKPPAKPQNKKKSSFTGKQLPLESETVWFLLVSALDVFMTYLLIRRAGFTEGNPVAAYFLHRWDVKGLVFYKFFMVAFVTIITQIIARTREDIAARLLQFATLVVGGVVVYSLILYLRHAGI